MTFIKKNCGGILLCAVIAALAEFLCTLSIGRFSLELVGVPVISNFNRYDNLAHITKIHTNPYTCRRY